MSLTGSGNFDGAGSSDSETSKHFYEHNSLSDEEESLNSEQRMVVENLLPHRKFGGHAQG